MSAPRAVRAAALGVVIGLANPVSADDEALTGVFAGTGRACAGALYVHTQTIEWNSTYSLCTPTRYEILEKNRSGEPRRIVYRLKARSHRCRFEVIELEHASGYNWNVSGYPSLEGFQKRNLPDWVGSDLDGRQVLSCLMVAR
jgi:hypothetical protein